MVKQIPEPYPGSCWISPKRKTSQCLVTCTINVSWYSEVTYCVPVWIHCLLCCQWATVKRAWLCCLCTLPSSSWPHLFLLWLWALKLTSRQRFLWSWIKGTEWNSGRNNWVQSPEVTLILISPSFQVHNFWT